MKRNKKAKKESSERWLLTYADLITLLMIFFVVLYALSNVDAKKFKAVSDALNKSLGGSEGLVHNYPGPSAVNLPNAPSPGTNIPSENEHLEELANELNKYLENNNLSAKVTVITEERGVVLSFQDPVIFLLGSAELSPTARPVVRGVGDILIKTPNYIRVEGHTDNLPINNNLYPSNWELSSARATKVVQEMIRENGFPPRRLSATGYGEYRPRANNDSEVNRQLNRRVDIVVLRSKYQESESISPLINQ
jgi:chemotaxis protein MotB